ncbi:MAG: drug/metabolite transporter (DMT)-like permease [Paraglaciecola sp.]
MVGHWKLAKLKKVSLLFESKKRPTFAPMKNPLSTSNPNREMFAIFLILCGSITFSAKAVLVKLAYQYDVDTVSLMALRMGFALPFFIAIAWHSNRKSATKSTLTKKDYGFIFLFGILGFYVASLFDFFGLKYVTASLERVVLFTYPTLVLLLSFLFLKKKITRIEAFALILTYIGIGIAMYENFTMPEGDNVLFGCGLVFMAALAYAIYLIGSGKMLTKMGTLQYNSLAMLSACSAILLHHAVVYNFQLFHFAKEVYFFAFLMAIFSTVLASFLVTAGVRIIGASKASIISGIGPISTIVLAYIFLGERLSWLQWIGTIVVIAGVMLITLNKGENNSK